MTDDDTGKRANVRLHPWSIIIGSFAIASLGKDLWHIDHLSGSLALVRYAGIVLMGVGFVLLLIAYAMLIRARTTIDTKESTTSFVSTGVYRFTRNPIYLGWFAVLLGAGLENLSLVQSGVATIMIALLHWAVVLPEEQYLEATFGDLYVQYRGSVRRWL